MSDMQAYILAGLLAFVIGGIIVAIFFGGERDEK